MNMVDLLVQRQLCYNKCDALHMMLCSKPYNFSCQVSMYSVNTEAALCKVMVLAVSCITCSVNTHDMYILELDGIKYYDGRVLCWSYVRISENNKCQYAKINFVNIKITIIALN